MVNSRVNEMMQLMVLAVETMMVVMQLTGLVILTMILTHRCHHLPGPAHLVPGLVVMMMILPNSVYTTGLSIYIQQLVCGQLVLFRTVLEYIYIYKIILSVLIWM